MELLLHSPLLLAIGYALIQSIAQFAVLWLLVQLLNVVCITSSHQKYYLFVTAQLVGFFGFIFTIIAHYFSYSVSGISTTSLFPITVEYSFLHSLNDKANQYLSYLSALYLVVLLVFIYRLSRAFVYTRHLRLHTQNPAPTLWQNFVLAKSAELKIKKAVKVFVSEYIHTPLTIGYFKPIILVPLSCINHLTTVQMEAVLLHELAHIKRYDYLLNIMLCTIQHILYFNPFVWFISKQINVQREYSCDDWVIRHQFSPAIYAQALVSVASRVHFNHAFALPASDQKILLSRITRLITKHKEKGIRINAIPVFFSVLTVLMSVINPATQIEKISNGLQLAENKPEIQSLFVVENTNTKLNVDESLKHKSKQKIKTNVVPITNSSKPALTVELSPTDNTTIITPVALQKQPKADKSNITSVAVQLESAIKNNLLKDKELIYINNALIKLWQEKYKTEWSADNEMDIMHTADYIASATQTPAQIINNINQILADVKLRNKESAETPSLLEKVIVIEIPQADSDSCRQIVITEKLLKIIRI